MISIKTALLLLSASFFTLAAPPRLSLDKDIDGKPMQTVARRQPQDLPEPPQRIPYCQSNAVLTALNVPSNSANSAFCSAYLQSTTTATVGNTVTSTGTAQTTVTSRATVTSVSTAPTPLTTTTVVAPGVRCRVNGYGTAQYNVGSGPSSSANFASCKALCAGNANCKSFGYGGGQCALYSVSAATNVRPAATQYYFYDLACPTEFPATPARKRSTGAAIPDYFTPAEGNPAFITSACNCFVSQPAPISTTVTGTSTSTVGVTITNTVTVTTTSTVRTTTTPPTSTATTTTTAGISYG